MHISEPLLLLTIIYDPEMHLVLAVSRCDPCSSCLQLGAYQGKSIVEMRDEFPAACRHADFFFQNHDVAKEQSQF